MNSTPCFERLAQKFGSHTAVAAELGTTPSHYRYIRRTGRMSGAMKRLLTRLCSELGEEEAQGAGETPIMGEI
jgi:hypothetical protein